MDRLKNAKKTYLELKANNNQNCIIYLFIIDCLEEATNFYKLKLTEKEKDDLAFLVHDYYLDTDIQRSKISDILCEHYNELDNDDFNIYDFIGFDY